MATETKIVEGFHREQIVGIDKHSYFSFRKVRIMSESAQDFFQVYRPGAAKQPASEAMDLGKLVHLGVLEQQKFREKFVVMPVFTGKTKDGRDSEQSAEARAAKKEWCIAQELMGKIIVTPEDKEIIIDSVEMILNYPPARKLLSGGFSEGWGYVWDEQFQRWQLIRPDFVSNSGITVDLKTTTKPLPSKEQWVRTVFYDGHHIQQAHNARGFSLMRAKDDPKLQAELQNKAAWIVLKTSFPRAIAVYTADENMMIAGRAKCFKAYHNINEHLARDPEMKDRWSWPGKQTQSEEVGFTHWQLAGDPDYEGLTQANEP